MFGSLKEKLKGALSKFSKKVEEEVVEKEEIREDAEKEEVVEKEEVREEVKEEIVEEEVKEKVPERVKDEKPVEEKPEKKTFISKIKEVVSTKKISEKKFEELFWSLEVALMENNVAVEVIEKIKQDLKIDLVDVALPRNVEKKVEDSLKESVEELFENEFDIIEGIKKKEKPYVILFLGVNGSGKTTTISKFVKLLKDNDLSCVVGAADTFRAAAIQQLEEHGKKLGVKVVKHDYGSDPAAVAFDAKKYAKAKSIDVVLIDTAGRLHSNANLMDEVKKIARVVEPDFKIFVGESIVGNDAVEQAKQFNESVGVDGIVLTKADVDEKGGAAVSIGYIIRKPVLYFGIGQEHGDLEKFDSKKVLEGIGF